MSLSSLPNKKHFKRFRRHLISGVFWTVAVVSLIYPFVSEKGGFTTSDDVNEIAVSEIAVFPNPTSDFINISLSKMPLQPLEMVIFDAKGSKVKKVVLTEQKTVIDLKKLESGNYFYEIGNEGAIIHSGKILKE